MSASPPLKFVAYAYWDSDDEIDIDLSFLSQAIVSVSPTLETLILKIFFTGGERIRERTRYLGSLDTLHLCKKLVDIQLDPMMLLHPSQDDQALEDLQARLPHAMKVLQFDIAGYFLEVMFRDQYSTDMLLKLVRSCVDKKRSGGFPDWHRLEMWDDYTADPREKERLAEIAPLCASAGVDARLGSFTTVPSHVDPAAAASEA